MCDCCNSEGIDFKMTCGNLPLRPARLYKVYIEKVASVKLCRLCDIELFRLGESRFLASHINFARMLVERNSRPAESLFD